MPFLHFTESNCLHEWGFKVADGFIPAVNDVVELEFATPDQDQDGEIDSVIAVILKRVFWFACSGKGDDSIECHVVLEHPIPDGCVANSRQWPAKEHSKRKRELEAELGQI